MKKMVSVVCTKVVRSKEKEIIGSREVINEIIDHGPTIESTTWLVIKMTDGRILAKKVIYKSVYPNSQRFNKINLLTGMVTG